MALMPATSVRSAVGVNLRPRTRPGPAALRRGVLAIEGQVFSRRGTRPCNPACTQTVLQRIAPRLPAFAGKIATLAGAALAAIARTIKRRQPQQSAPRNHPKVKPQPSAACKG